jgi:putative 4-mercaptohistidine N1-methyltranferase
MSFYESSRLLSEYLLFHYGTAEQTLSFDCLPAAGLGFPVRCVSECLGEDALTAGSRALDLGCAVGRSTFELARHCTTVVGIDASRSFIEAASALKANGELRFSRIDEGELTTSLVARVPPEIDRSRVEFGIADAMDLPTDLGEFDFVLMANLIDRLTVPQRCLQRLPALVKQGGKLVVTSPYTWLPEFTPRENWLGGFGSGTASTTTLDGLQAAIGPSFELCATRELPFLLREHARKFQFSVAQASIWVRR